jgi:hypothetical protein
MPTPPEDRSNTPEKVIPVRRRVRHVVHRALCQPGQERRRRAGPGPAPLSAGSVHQFEAGGRRRDDRSVAQAQFHVSQGPRPQNVDPFLLHQPPGPQDRDFVAELLDLRQRVAGKQDRAAGGNNGAQLVVQCRAHEWIKRGRGLVQDQEPGSMHQRGDQPQLLLHATRVVTHAPVQVQVEARDEARQLVTGAMSPRGVEKRQRRAAREPAVEAHVAR